MNLDRHRLNLTWALLIGLAAGCGQAPPPQQPAAPVPTDTVPVSVLEEAQAEIKSLRADREADRRQRRTLEEQLNDLTEESGELIDQLVADLEESKAETAEAQAAASEKEEGIYPDEIVFKTGTRTRCRVLGMEDGLLNVQLPSGETKKARLSDVASARARLEAHPEREIDQSWVTAPRPSEPDEPEPPAFRTDGLRLSSFWNIAVPASTQKTADLFRLLRDHGTAQDDRSPRPGAELYNGVYYLMPMAQAIKALGISGAATRHPLGTAGFPQKSLTYFEYKGSFDNRFDKLLMVTDLANQVVAIQLVESLPSKAFLRSSLHEEADQTWHLFNLVEGRGKGRSESGVKFRVRRLSQDVLRIESEYVNSKGETSECTRLFLPQPLADIILHLVETRY